MVFASLRVCKWVCHPTAAFTTLANNININSWTTNENWSCILTNRDDVFERTHKEETQISFIRIDFRNTNSNVNPNP